MTVPESKRRSSSTSVLRRTSRDNLREARFEVFFIIVSLVNMLRIVWFYSPTACVEVTNGLGSQSMASAGLRSNRLARISR